LIDDDPDDLEMLGAALEASGMRVKTFPSGENAEFYLQLLSRMADRPCLVILDFNMPGMNGQQVLATIKHMPVAGNIPVVIYSTGMSAQLKTTLLDLGAENCFIKPSSYAGFLSQVNLFREIVDKIKAAA
jgi:CheY-like chemotaxis protein